MSKKRIKQYLMLLTVVGLVAIAAGGGNGTFASFNAEVTNAGNTFAAGTLFLHENGKNSSGTAITECDSEGGTLNVNNTCDVLFNNVNLASGAATADIALANAGSIPASDVEIDSPSCAWSNNGQGPSGNSTFTFITPPANCNGVYFTVQETNSTYTVPGSDVYCALGPSVTPHTDCSAPDNTRTLGGTSSFAPLQMTGGVNATLDAAGGANDTRYYVIKVDPSGVGTGNQLQNLKLTFSLSFHIDQ